MNSAAVMLTLMWWLGSIVRPASHWHRCCDVKKVAEALLGACAKKGKLEEAVPVEMVSAASCRLQSGATDGLRHIKAVLEIDIWNPTETLLLQIFGGVENVKGKLDG